MLWTDTYIVTTADLLTIDPEVGDVATAESITVDGSTGIVQRTYEAASQQLLAQMQRFGGYLSSGLVSANHLAAVFNVGGPGVNRTRVLLGQIIAFDPYNPLVKTWLCYRTLEKFFHAAFSRTMQDRYEKKMKQYATDVRNEFWPNVKNAGLPVVYRPMPCPGAVNERVPGGFSQLQSGTWSAANVTTAAKAGTTGGTFDVAVTYVDQTLYVGPRTKTNAESYTSARITQVVAAGQALQINISSLTPPNAGSDPAMLPSALTTPLNASGWNVYVGQQGGTLYLQNASPIPCLGASVGSASILQPVYTLAGDPVLAGYAADYGQYADAYFTIQDLIQRG